MNRSKILRFSGGASSAVVCAALIVGLTPSSAFAAPSVAPPREKIIRDCQTGKGRCKFDSPLVRKVYLGEFRQVSDYVYNCGSDPVNHSITWSDTVESSSTIGMQFEAGGVVTGILNISFAANYGHTWNDSHSETDELTVNIRPGEVGWIERAQVMRKVSGVWKTNYRFKKNGHRKWEVPDVVTGPAPRGTEGLQNAVVFKSRVMTESEVKSCNSSKAEPIRKKRVDRKTARE
ncbi:hypothetical protein ACN6AT_37295 (plasmid) [Streptomyces sp. JL4002]|uniref:hypothetical protein n=1 Tax=Streptomyces sp. JL4002 TaxID=3404781 RepID=UPI003B2835DB